MNALHRLCLLSLSCLMGFSFLGCASFRSLPAEEILRSAEEDLRPWKEKWAASGRAAEEQDLDRAEDALKKLRFLESRYAGQVEMEKLSFQLAQAHFANANWSQAYRKLCSHLENFPLTSLRNQIERLIYQIAVRWEQDHSFSLRSLFISNASRAMDALNYLVENAPHSPYADDALRLMAEIHLSWRDYTEAISVYERILQGYPDSIWCDLAQFRIGWSYLQRAADPRSDRDALLQAESRLKEYLDKRNEGNFRKQAQTAHLESIERLAQSELHIAEFYETIEKPEGSRFHYQTILSKYPQSQASAKASERLKRMP